MEKLTRIESISNRLHLSTKMHSAYITATLSFDYHLDIGNDALYYFQFFDILYNVDSHTLTTTKWGRWKN